MHNPITARSYYVQVSTKDTVLKLSLMTWCYRTEDESWHKQKTIASWKRKQKSWIWFDPNFEDEALRSTKKVQVEGNTAIELCRKAFCLVRPLWRFAQLALAVGPGSSGSRCRKLQYQRYHLVPSLWDKPTSWDNFLNTKVDLVKQW